LIRKVHDQICPCEGVADQSNQVDQGGAQRKAGKF